MLLPPESTRVGVAWWAVGLWQPGVLGYFFRIFGHSRVVLVVPGVLVEVLVLVPDWDEAGLEFHGVVFHGFWFWLLPFGFDASGCWFLGFLGNPRVYDDPSVGNVVFIIGYCNVILIKKK
ncbi:hypothetical protein AMTRI_Chr08g203730 [Amborella trichopoda]